MGSGQAHRVIILHCLNAGAAKQRIFDCEKEIIRWQTPLVNTSGPHVQNNNPLSADQGRDDPGRHKSRYVVAVGKSR